MAAASDLFDDFFQRFIQIDGGNLVAGNHDVFDRRRFKVEYTQQHVLVTFWNHCPGLGNHCA